MVVNGVFQRIEVEDTRQQQTWTVDDVDFRQDGFCFTFFVDSDYHPLFDTGYTVYGIVDGDTVARGSITSITPVSHEGQSSLRIVSTPPTNQAPNMKRFE